MAKSIEERVKTTIADQLGLGDDEVRDNADIIQDLGADSLDVVELVMAMEEDFDIDIPDEDVEDIHTVGEVVTYVKGKLR